MQHDELHAILNGLWLTKSDHPMISAAADNVVEDFDFNTLTEERLAYFDSLSWVSVKFKDCIAIPGNAFKYCEFQDSTFRHEKDSIEFKHCLATFTAAEYVDAFKLARNTSSSKGNLLVDHHNRKLIIAAVVDPDSGFYDDTPVMLKQFKHQSLSVVRVYCDAENDPFLGDSNTPAHPIFSYPEMIDGFYLPGGDDIVTTPDKYTKREKMERYFIDAALAFETPLLGVCRGHQMVAHYFGADIEDIYDSSDDEDIHESGNLIRVMPEASRLFALSKQRHEASLKKSKPTSLRKVGDVYRYRSRCAHSQAAFFKSERDPRVMITARAADDVIEGLEVNGHIITYQHHHELRYKEQGERFSKAVIKDFMRLVEAYNAKKVERLRLDHAALTLHGRAKKKRIIKPKRSNTRQIRVIEVKDESGEVGVRVKPI